MNVALHPRFDLDFFANLYPLEQLRKDAYAFAVAVRERNGEPFDPDAIAKHAWLLEPHGEYVTSPYDLAIIEMLRRELEVDELSAERVPTDVFVFGEGEPPAPHLTKIGGVPFRPRRAPWPMTEDGRARAFVGQLSFVDSRDLYPDLPGDVLLVFADPEDLFAPTKYHLEWRAIGEGEAFSPAEVPDTFRTWTPGPRARREGKLPEVHPFTIKPCYGVIYRSYDLPGQGDNFDRYYSGDRIAVFEATKIGGVPSRIQEGHLTATPFLASIASVQPSGDKAYPWVNRPEPIEQREVYRLPTWMLGDMGSLLLSLDGQNVRIQAECY